jgi:AcrR family transcriptional regulator
MITSVQTKQVREAILDSTDRLLAQYSYKKTAIEDLAIDVGIGKGSIYLHFTSKEEIVLSHIDRIVDRLKKRLFVIASKEISPAARIQEMLVTRVLFRFDSVQHYTRSLDDLLSAVRRQLLLRRKKHFQDETGTFSEVLEIGNRSGDFIACDSARTAEMLLTATNSLLPYSLSTKELGERKEIKEKVSHLAALLLNGILSRPQIATHLNKLNKEIQQ